MFHMKVFPVYCDCKNDWKAYLKKLVRASSRVFAKLRTIQPSTIVIVFFIQEVIMLVID